MATRSVRLMQASTKSFLAVALLGFAAGCSNGDVEEEIVQSTEQAKVIGTNDFVVVKVSPVPPVAIAVDYAARPAIDTTLTIFSHPRSRPLEWSQTCLLKPASSGGWGADQFSHQCDTDPGSSGATILNDASLAVIGIHDGGTYSWNYGTFLSDTPLAEILAAAPATATATEDELEPATP